MLYAIGDIHGMYDKLVELYEKIKQHASNHPEPHKLIFLGDYIDRGPDSKKVIEFVQNDDGLFERIFICGNHEDMFLDTIMDAHTRNISMSSYLSSDEGLATLRSYIPSITVADINTRRYEILKETADLYDFLTEHTVCHHKHGKYVFVHAGFDPRLGGFLQSEPEHWMWVRKPFLESEEEFYWSDDVKQPIIVVHGHTPVEEPTVKKNRINIDTGACFGGIPIIGKPNISFGKLTCVAIDPESDTHEFIQSS